MNRRQKIVVLAGVVVVALMLLVPPWQRTSAGYSAIIKGASYSPPTKSPVGYGLIFSPPANAHSIDTTRLFVQCGLVAVLTFGLYVLLGHKKES